MPIYRALMVLGCCLGDEGRACSRRRVAIAERSVVEDGTAAAGPAAASAGLSQSAGARPGGDGCDLLRAAHGMPMERAERHRDLLVVLGASAVPGMDRGRRVRDLLAGRPAC